MVNLTDRLKESLEIYNEAMVTYKPYAVVLMLSGGDDSVLTMNVLKELDIKPDFIMHGVTGTGIQEANNFVRRISNESGIKYLEANAGDAYERYVMRKGFFGTGVSSHALSYHLLKQDHFTRTVHLNIRQRRKNRNVLFLCGIRIDESENRRANFGDITMQRAKKNSPNIWVHIVHWWTTKERDEYLSGHKIERNPVSVLLGRSGECMCGTMQSMATGLQAAELFPEWGKWWLDIRKRVISKFPWDWGQSINPYHLQEMNGQGNLFKVQPFMPMCTGCKAKAAKNIFI